MAQVAQRLHRQPDVDYHLDYQFRAWQGIPEYAEWWLEMDGTEKEVFHLEWIGITESRLDQLQQWAEQGLLTPAQCERYDQLLELVAQHRPTVEALLRES